MKKEFFAILCLAITVQASASDIRERLESLMPAGTAAALVGQGTVNNSAYRLKDAEPVLAPNLPIARESLAFWSGRPPPFFNESLYLYRKPAGRQGFPGNDTEKISVVLRSLSRLEGLEYYSTSRKKMRTLYDKSYAVDSKDRTHRVGDPISGSADGLSVNAVQKDLTFGEYLFNYSYRQDSLTVAFFSRNIDPMSYTVLKVLEGDKLHVSLVIHDMGDYLLVYSLTRADFLAVPGIDGKLQVSFSTRAEAVYKWIIKEYEKN